MLEKLEHEKKERNEFKAKKYELVKVVLKIVFLFVNNFNGMLQSSVFNSLLIFILILRNILMISQTGWD